MTAKPTVCIGFADALSAPEVVWSLSDAGFHVVTFAKVNTRPVLLKSLLAQVEYITDPAVSVKEALADLQKLVQHDSPILMPLDDASLWLIQELSKRISVQVAGARGRQAEVALDKRLQLEAAADAGFFVPETLRLESMGDTRRMTCFPAIVKPALAARTSGGSLGRGRAHMIADAKEFQAFTDKWNLAEPMLAQPLLTGPGEGLFGFALEDKVVCWSGHRRIRMMNPAGSGASACVSMKTSREIRAVAERFLKSIGWRGIFMIELLRAEDGKLWFIELNGRPWGSMALARRLGLEYPAWDVHRLMDPAFVPEEPPEQPPLVCRHLGRELLHLAFVWRGPKSQALRNWPSRMKSLREVLRIRRDERWYNNNKKDPRVFWADTWQTLISTRSGRNFSSLATGGWSRLKRPVVRYEQTRIRQSGRVPELVKRCRHLLFLCYGNINRSALAEQHLRQLVGSELEISSCGFHSPDCRPIDPMMLKAAKDVGIPLSAWSSRTISTELVEAADLILAMEASQLIRLFREFPGSQGRAFLLSCVTKPKTIPLEISDPFGGTLDNYKRCIHEVTYATSAITAIINSHKGRIC